MTAIASSKSNIRSHHSASLTKHSLRLKTPNREEQDTINHKKKSKNTHTNGGKCRQIRRLIHDQSKMLNLSQTKSDRLLQSLWRHSEPKQSSRTPKNMPRSKQHWSRLIRSLRQSTGKPNNATTQRVATSWSYSTQTPKCSGRYIKCTSR